MRPRISVGLSRFGAVASVLLCLVAACTGDDEIYATPKDAGPASDAPVSSSSSSGGASSSSGGTGTPDGSSTTDAATDGGNDGSTSTDGGDGGGGVDSGMDSGVVVDSGVDSGPVVCTLVPCAANVTCTNLGCGNCNLGQGFCKN